MTGNANVRVEWGYPYSNPLNTPSGFHVYIGLGSPNYSVPYATVPFSASYAGTFVANLSGLLCGVTYMIGVRAFNAVAEEPNTYTVSVLTDCTGPLPVDSLVGIAI